MVPKLLHLFTVVPIGTTNFLVLAEFQINLRKQVLLSLWYKVPRFLVGKSNDEPLYVLKGWERGAVVV